MKIKVLGTTYDVNIVKQDDYLERGSDGYCDFGRKKIVVKENACLKEKAIRHELVHAFMFESGLDIESEYARNEELIDWIALQGEKLIEAWKEAGAI